LYHTIAMCLILLNRLIYILLPIHLKSEITLLLQCYYKTKNGCFGLKMSE